MEWKSEVINKIILGNSATILKAIPNDQIDLVVTSPPYFLQREYGNLNHEIGNEPNVETYITNVMAVFSECVRIIKQSGSIIFNIGDCYLDGNLLLVPYRFALAAQKKNVKLINTICWVKRNPTPRQFKRRLVTSTEPFFHFVKSNNYFYNLEEFQKKDKKVIKINKDSKIGTRYFQMVQTSNLNEEQKSNANKDLKKVIEEVKMGKITGFRMKINGLHAPAFGGMNGGRKIQMERNGYTIIRILGNGIKRDVIETPVETIKGRIHPAVYPESIIRELIKLTTSQNDIVLDPFVGSGTTCFAAKKLSRRYVGIDINKDYCAYARKKLEEMSSIENFF